MIWYMSKVGSPKYEDFGGKLVNVKCELTDELVFGVEIENGLLATSCVWDSIDKGVLK